MNICRVNGLYLTIDPILTFVHRVLFSFSTPSSFFLLSIEDIDAEQCIVVMDSILESIMRDNCKTRRKQDGEKKDRRKRVRECVNMAVALFVFPSVLPLSTFSLSAEQYVLLWCAYTLSLSLLSFLSFFFFPCCSSCQPTVLRPLETFITQRSPNIQLPHYPHRHLLFLFRSLRSSSFHSHPPPHPPPSLSPSPLTL